jgi:acyl-coenzyme A thioesterase PaaI-like protein
LSYLDENLGGGEQVVYRGDVHSPIGSWFRRLGGNVSRTVASTSINFKETVRLRAVGFLKIPMLFFLSPTVVELTDHRCAVKLPLTRRSKNHLGSMYFGALAAGADCAGGMIAWNLLEKAQAKGMKPSLVFKDFHAEFLKRAEGDVVFTCEDGQSIRQLVERVSATGERESIPVHITATVPSKLGSEPVARFVLTLSLKKWRRNDREG